MAGPFRRELITRVALRGGLTDCCHNDAGSRYRLLNRINEEHRLALVAALDARHRHVLAILPVANAEHIKDIWDTACELEELLEDLYLPGSVEKRHQSRKAVEADLAEQYEIMVQGKLTDPEMREKLRKAIAEHDKLMQRPAEKEKKRRRRRRPRTPQERDKP